MTLIQNCVLTRIYDFEVDCKDLMSTTRSIFEVIWGFPFVVTRNSARHVGYKKKGLGWVQFLRKTCSYLLVVWKKFTSSQLLSSITYHLPCWLAAVTKLANKLTLSACWPMNLVGWTFLDRYLNGFLLHSIEGMEFEWFLLQFLFLKMRLQVDF